MPRKFDFISPGIQLTEIDQSTVPAQSQGDGPLLIGRALRGPSMQPIRIKSFDDFVSVFENQFMANNLAILMFGEMVTLLLLLMLPLQPKHG